MLKKLLLAFAVLLVVTVVGFAVYAYHPELDPVATNDLQGLDAATVAKGRVLAAAGYCVTCHTAEGGAPYAGNYAMATGFGTVYSTNITPDPEFGIGNWSEEAFLRSMREGVDREGRHLFPAFPYEHFTRMSDDDIRAIYAYLITEVAPVQVPQKDNELPFPLNQRILQAGWKMLFVDFGIYEDEADRSNEWNRGAYLVEGLTHCGACHTPRNALGAEIESEQFAGAAIDRWLAPALTADNVSAVPWTAADYSEYLKSGATRTHGIAAGPMSPVVHAGLRELPDSDLDAIGTYLSDIVGSPDSERESARIVAASLETGKPQKSYRKDQGERLYATACASCHYNVQQIALGRPDLGINSATRLEAPDNLIHVMLDGVGNEEGLPGIVMPGFRDALNDNEIALIAAYLRTSRTEKAAWSDLPGRVSAIRAEGVAAQSM